MKPVSILLGLPLLLSSLAAPVSATATAPRNCGHLIADPRGNAYMWFLPTRPYNADADLLALDAKSTRAMLEFTVSMAAVSPTPATGTVVTIYFNHDYQGGSASYEVNVFHQIDGTTYSLQNDNTSQVTPMTGAVNTTAGTYVIQVPREAIKARYRGAPLTELGVIVSQTAGVDIANGGFIEQSTGPNHHYRLDYGYGCRR
jgi:hypothetical protein